MLERDGGSRAADPTTIVRSGDRGAQRVARASSPGAICTTRSRTRTSMRDRARVRIATSFEEADDLDRDDIGALSFEERISGVERLRRAEFLSALIAHRVRFVLVGGHAVGRPHRAEPCQRQAALRGARRPRFRRSSPVSGRRAPTTDRKRRRRDEVWKGRVEANFVVSPLYVIGREQLLTNKRAATGATPADVFDRRTRERPMRARQS